MDLIFLHGPPAAGKFKVGTELAAITGYPLFHNHLIVDAVSAVFQFGSESFVRLRQAFWLEVFATAASEGRSLIFTYAPDETVPGDSVPQTLEKVGQAGGRVVFVELVVSEFEQERRVVAEERSRFNNLRSVETLRQLREAGGKTRPPVDLSIDTDQTAAAIAAQQIQSAFGLVPLITGHKPFAD